LEEGAELLFVHGRGRLSSDHAGSLG
jgi:hypothetical protein